MTSNEIKKGMKVKFKYVLNNDVVTVRCVHGEGVLIWETGLWIICTDLTKV